MKLISHRGNVLGKQKENENNPNYIQSAINSGYDVEVDLWVVSGKMFLGHDNPEYLVGENYFLERSNRLWLHAKNIPAIEILAKTNLHWFWHENDQVTLTSKQILWSLPGVIITGSVVNQPNKDSLYWKLPEKETMFYGVCLDEFPKIT